MTPSPGRAPGTHVRYRAAPLRVPTVTACVLTAALCVLGGCATREPVLTGSVAEPPAVRLGPVLTLFELTRDDFAPNVRAIADSAGQVHVLVGCDIKKRTATYEIVVGADAVLERRYIAAAEPRFAQSTHSISWDAVDGAFDAQGVLHALVGDRQFVFADGAWRPSANTPWQDAGVKVESARFVRGAPRLVWALEVAGKDVGAHARWDVWGFGNALGGLMWPWRTRGTRTVIVPEIADGYPLWTVLEPQGKQDTLATDVAADGRSNVHVLYSKVRGGIFAVDDPRSGLPPAQRAEVHYGRISAQDLTPGAQVGSARAGSSGKSPQLRAFTGRLRRAAWSPTSLAVDPELGNALIGTQWRVNGDTWSGPLAGSTSGYGRVAPAGQDQFQAVIVGRGLTDGRLDTKNVPLVYRRLSGQTWSGTLELGAVAARDALAFIPDKIDVVDAGNGRAFVVWPTREGVVGRWIDAGPQ